jgi:DMSO/TMAO reductase YedYZ heme-binding membrane subunit
VAGVSHATLWYVDRGSGLVALLLLSAGVVLGVISALRVHSPGWPRFALADLHRNIGLLAVCFGAVHGATSVLDSFVDIRLTDLVVPFGSHFRPLWVGVGAIAVDLTLAVLLTSAIRRRLGYRRWRAVHLLAYGAWTATVVHSVGMGTDARATWALVLMARCIGAIGGALVLRLNSLAAVRAPAAPR